MFHHVNRGGSGGVPPISAIFLANNNFAKGEGYPSDGKNMPKSQDSEVLLCSITHSSFALEIENDLTSKSVTPLY